MPTTRPSDQQHEENSQWWKKDKHGSNESNRDPKDPKIDSRMGKNKFDEEQKPTQNPT